LTEDLRRNEKKEESKESYVCLRQQDDVGRMLQEMQSALLIEIRKIKKSCLMLSFFCKVVYCSYDKG
jgi:hypothetical protein